VLSNLGGRDVVSGARLSLIKPASAIDADLDGYLRRVDRDRESDDDE
jgi:hypothetical protein